MAEPLMKWKCVGGIAFYRMRFVNVGDRNKGGAHSFDHPTIIDRGAVRIISNGMETVFREDDVDLIYIPAFVEHEMIAEEPNTKVTCVQGLRRRDNPGLLIDPEDVPAGTPPWAYSVPLLLKDALREGFTMEQLRAANQEIARGALDFEHHK
jgi:hypothetical protein